MGGEFAVGDGERPQLRARHRIAAIADRQHRVISREELLRLGLPKRRISRMVAGGYLYEIHRGVYAVGHRALAREGRWMAGVLALGSEAVLSHLTAAMLWRLIDPTDGFPHVTTPACGHRRSGLIRHTAILRPDEVTIRDGIPVTSVSRTLLDLARTVDPFRLERALAQADFHRYAIRPSFATLLDRHCGQRGVAVLREVLASGSYELGPTESPLEERFLRFLDERRLERPELNVPFDLEGHPIRPDGIWREAGVVVELDSRKAHMTTSRFESDRVRDRKLHTSGLVPVRVTKAQLTDRARADALEADLLKLGVRRCEVPA